MASRRKRALEMLEPDPLPLFFVHSGFRFVLPQYYTHHIYAKGRWLRPAADGSPQSYLSLMTAEFPSYTDQYHPLALRSSRVLVNSAPVRPSDPVRPGDLLTHRVHHHEPPSTAELPALLCSTDRFLVVSKPAGLATHASGVILHGTLLRALTDMSRAHPGILSPPSESSDVAPAAVSAAVGASPSPAVSIAPPPTGADENPPRGGPPSSWPWVPPPLGEYSVYRSFSSASASSSSAAPGGHSAGGFHPAHRLDRATSGVIVLARDAPAATGLGAVFAERAEKATSSAGAGDEDDCGQYDVATLLSDTFYTDAPALSGTAKESAEEPSTQQKQDGKPYVRKSYLARVRGRFPRSAADAGLLPCGHPPLFREPTRPASSEGESKGGEWFLVRVPVKSVGMAKSFQAVPLPQLSSFLSSSSAPAAASIGADACPLCTGSAAWQEPSGVETSTPTTPATDENNSNSSGGVWPGPVLAAAAARDTAWDGPPSMWPPMKEAVSAFRLVRTDSSGGADDGVTSLVECVPLTGRTHQLRVHLWWLGTPIANDAAYGGVPCRGDCAPPLANVPWPGVAGITPAAVGGGDEQQAQESTAGGWDAPLETSNGTIAPVAFIPAHIASSSPQPADSSAFWSPLLASKADLAAWASSTKAETVRAVAAVAADEDGYDARHSTEAGEHICSSGEEKNEEEGEAGTGPDPWCPSCVRFARTRRSRPAVPSQNSEGKTVDAAAAAARNVSLAGNTFRIWLHAWRLRARGSLPPAPAPIAAAGGHNSGVGRKNRGKNANGNAPREPFAIDVVAPAPEWAGETFDAAEWLREPLAKSPRNYPFVWGNKE